MAIATCRRPQFQEHEWDYEVEYDLDNNRSCLLRSSAPHPETKMGYEVQVSESNNKLFKTERTRYPNGPKGVSKEQNLSQSIRK